MPAIGIETAVSEDEDLTYVLIRTELLAEELEPSESASPVVTADILSRSLLAKGFSYLVYPQVLLTVVLPKPSKATDSLENRRYSAMARAQRAFLQPMDHFFAAPLPEKVDLIRRALKQPRRAAQRIAWQLRNATHNLVWSR